MSKGVLFDMDGFFVDAEEYIAKAAIKMFDDLGVKVKKEDFTPFIGAGEDRYVGGVAEKYGVKKNLEELKARTYELYGEIVKNKLEPLEGVEEFIKKCREKGLKMAVATSADEIKMNINLDEIGFPRDHFDATVNGLEIENKKPDPGIFLLAAKKIGLSPGECLVVEDAVNGVKAAKKAGAKCLALTTSFRREDLSDADWIAENLASVPPEALNW